MVEITDCRGTYSIYSKTFLFNIDGIDYDLSNLIPDDVWNICTKFPTHPEEDWRIRIELRKVFIKWFKENIDENIDENKVVF